MRFRGRGVAATIALTLALVLVAAACGGSDDDDGDAGAPAGDTGSCAEYSGSTPVNVGGTNFSEQEIVAEMYAQCLAAAGFKVTKKLKLGSREIVLPALERGDIDLYPEYVGTVLTYLNGTPTPDLDQSLADLRERFKAKNVSVLEPSPAEDKNGFAVTRATADKHALKKLSDLQPVAGQLVFGGSAECPERPYCLIGLKQTYGLTFKEVKKLDAGGPLTKDALERGDIDVGLIFTSDGAVVARNFVVLEDDKKLQPVENIVPAVRDAVLTDDLRGLLDSISEKLTTEDLSELNKRVDIDKADPADVAGEWLKEHGFVK